MEYLDGPSLERLIRRRRPLGLQHRFQIVVQLCEALAYAHEQSIVHRNVKPANILIMRDGTGYRTLNARTGMFFYATGITPAMGMRLRDIGSQYLGAFVDSKGEYLDGSKTYKVTLPPDIPARAFWSVIIYDNQTRSMLQTPQRYPRAGSQTYPGPAAVANPDGSGRE
jgi:hypothetical protein